MQTIWKTRLKRLLALAAALLVLNLFCYWYYNPTAYVREESRATDVVREPGAFTSRAKEGFAAAVMDANGYNNASVPGEGEIYALMMGASHTEGLNVAQHETTSARLSAYLSAAGVQGSAYNIGISSHMLPRNAANLRRALERFRPTAYVVIETPDVMLYQSAVEDAMNDGFERIEETRLPFAAVSNQPLSKALYRQWMSLNGAGEEEDAAPMVITDEMLALYEAALTELFGQMRATAQEFGVELIIYYHPHLALQPDGSALPQTDAGCLEAFSSACDAAGVRFLDMTGHFLSAYGQEHILPHGFANTAPGAGHLNAHGCDMVARALAEIMLGGEAGA